MRRYEYRHGRCKIIELPATIRRSGLCGYVAGSSMIASVGTVDEDAFDGRQSGLTKTLLPHIISIQFLQLVIPL